MSRLDWDISGTGNYTIIEECENKKLKITGEKYFLYHHNNVLIDSEIIAEIKIPVSPGSCAGLLLRATSQPATAKTFYLLHICSTGTNTRKYYLYKFVSNVLTFLESIDIPNRSYLKYYKTRFRIDGTQLIVEDYIDGEWQLILTTVDNEISNGGYTGFRSIGTAYVLFDNIEIKEKE